jgi:hypothetical protein
MLFGFRLGLALRQPGSKYRMRGYSLVEARVRDVSIGTQENKSKRADIYPII